MCHTFNVLLLPIVCLVTASFANAAPNATHSGYFSKIYAFGDSFTDTGNTNSKSGPQFFRQVSNPPYGNTYFHHPTSRYSDGRLVVDFLANALSLPFLPPYLNRSADFSHGVNFAVAGSTAIDHDFFVKNNVTLNITPQSLGTQLIWFDKFLQGNGCREAKSPECIMAMKDALFWVGEIGVNDYAYTIASTVPSSTVQDLAVRKVITSLQALLQKGAKYIVVQGLPLAGCLPLTLFLTPANDRDSLGCSASGNQVIEAHNSVLQSKIQELRKQYPQAFISYADYASAHRTVMMDPASFGLKETLTTCCGSGGPPYNFQPYATCGSPSASVCKDPAKYVNWDGVHLTEAMYGAVSDLLLRRGYCRPSFDQLLQSKGRRF
ncbi:hypothetical protein AAC387_Pa12g1097 [Persea americana]